MEILKVITSILFVVVCIALILFVLIQQPKQSGLSSSMGTGKDFFGGRGFEGGLVKSPPLWVCLLLCWRCCFRSLAAKERG
jgi:preprotein translocase subunit SecG